MKNTIRVNISLPPDLHKRMQQQKRNWSEVCRRAIEKELSISFREGEQECPQKFYKESNNARTS